MQTIAALPQTDLYYTQRTIPQRVRRRITASIF